MSARDEWPLLPDGTINASQWATLCGEIDRLRAEIDALKIMYRDHNQVTHGLDELISTLTTHADNLRTDLTDALNALERAGCVPWPRGTIEAYDKFMEEC